MGELALVIYALQAFPLFMYLFFIHKIYSYCLFLCKLLSLDCILFKYLNEYYYFTNKDS